MSCFVPWSRRGATLNSTGNFTAVPPYATAGRRFARGRLLLGSTPGNRPDPAFERMLTSQRAQPPVRLDTSWARDRPRRRVHRLPARAHEAGLEAGRGRSPARLPAAPRRRPARPRRIEAAGRPAAGRHRPRDTRRAARAAGRGRALDPRGTRRLRAARRQHTGRASDRRQPEDLASRAAPSPRRDRAAAGAVRDAQDQHPRRRRGLAADRPQRRLPPARSIRGARASTDRASRATTSSSRPSGAHCARSGSPSTSPKPPRTRAAQEPAAATCTAPPTRCATSTRSPPGGGQVKCSGSPRSSRVDHRPRLPGGASQ